MGGKKVIVSRLLSPVEFTRLGCTGEVVGVCDDGESNGFSDITELTTVGVAVTAHTEGNNVQLP